MNKSSNGIFSFLVTLALILLIASIGYIIYDETINKNAAMEDNINDNNNSLIEIDINSEEIENLVYPIYNRAFAPFWEYKDITINELEMLNMFRSSILGLTPVSEEEENNITNYSAEEIETNFRKIFGPDITYTNYDIVGNESCEGATYNEEDSTYSIIECENEDVDNNWNYVAKLYKAEKDNENIYTYFYVQPYYCSDETGCYTFDRETGSIFDAGGDVIDYKIKFDENLTIEEVVEEINSIINNKEVDTYKFTFKKQSDGNYYFYSGEWQ